MRTGLRKALKITGCSFGVVLLVLGSYLGLLFYPGVLFANKVEYKNFTVYSDQDLGSGVEAILRDVEAALETSAIYDPSLRHDIFFGHNNVVFGGIQRVRAELVSLTIGVPPNLTYNASWPPYISHIITFRIPDIQNNALVHPERPESINMTYTLTHEVVHSLVTARLGTQTIARLPMWKQEGYPEYIAASMTRARPGYAVRDSVSRILREDLSWLRDDHGDFTQLRYECMGKSNIRTEDGNVWPTCYYISRVLMEYLLDIKGLTFDQTMSLAIRDTDTLNELIAAYNAGGP